MSAITWRKSSRSSESDGNCVEVGWRRSSFSTEPDGNCVEVGWRKSSFSSEPDGNCVEVAFAQVAAAVRDSKNPAPVITVSEAAWRAFVGKLT